MTEDFIMKKEIKRGAFVCAMILILTMLIAILPTEAEAEIYEDTVRLHILAESDTAEDQNLKLLVRDLLLKEYGEILGNTDGVDGAISLIYGLLPEIEATVNEFIGAQGFDYTAKAELSREWFDTRVYEGYTLPQGYYHSLIIRIGKGEGQNWWCVMYPPMCLGAATSSGGRYTKEEERMIMSGKRSIKFKALEVFSELFK